MVSDMWDLLFGFRAFVIYLGCVTISIFVVVFVVNVSISH
jgi:hypothetical protein